MIDLDSIPDEIDHYCGQLQCEFENVMDNEGDQDAFDRLDEMITHIGVIRDALKQFYQN